MKKNILKSLFVGMLCMLAASCQDTEELAQVVDSSKAQVVFSIAMDSPIARSRADQSWGSYDPTDEGTPKDNHIDINQFVVKMEIQGTEYHLSDIIKWKAEGEENVYQFVGVVNGITKQTDVYGAKISVFANMGKDDESLITEFPYSVGNIPMWGVRTIGLDEDNKHPYLAPGTRVDLGSIALLRAMAKMEVALTPEMAADYDLKEVTLNKFNGTGNCFPTDYTSADNTQDMSTTGVFNPLDKEPQALLTFKEETYKTEDGIDKTSHIVYLPEVANQDNSLKVTVKLLPKGASDETPLETGTFAVMDYTNEASPVAIDIIRNHWYQYEISGFDANEIKVNYQTLDWQPVNFEVGGDGFLFLNKDVIEIYNSNIDADQLKFSSSSPIKSIVLKDLYTHDRDGNIVEGTTDGVSAYYISKFGQKIQLGTDPDFDISDKEAALAREAVILSNIKAVAESDKLNGGITITSPYLADPTNAISELQQNSHYDTPRYLEFLVTNEQDLTATFRVIQYPPVVITNIEGYFSYREDFRIGDLAHTYDVNQFSGNYPSCMTMPVDNGEPTHYHNPTTPFFILAGFYPYHIHEWDPVKNRVVRNPTSPSEAHAGCPDVKEYDGFDEIVSGLMERDYHRVEEYKGSPVSGVYHRTHYLWSDGAAFVGANIAKPQNYYQNVGPVFEKQYEVDDVDPETGEVIGKKTITKYYRRHYTGNSFNIFYSKFVELPINSDGTGIIGSQRCQYDYTAPYTMWSVWYPKGNHRMYHIRTTVTSDEYIIGKPNMITVDGRTYTGEGEANSRMVSPSFMVASMLGESSVPKDRDGYIVPKEGGLYPLAQRQCEQYVETSFEDINGNGTWEEGEPVTHYNDWRLPTKAEVALIEKYQNNSRAMDYLLPGETYYCASTVSGVYTAETVLSDPIEGATKEGYYMRCVRDVKPNENKQ